MLPDVNVRVAAYRSDHLHHKVAVDWLKHTRRDAKDGQILVLPQGPVTRRHVNSSASIIAAYRSTPSANGRLTMPSKVDSVTSPAT